MFFSVKPLSYALGISKVFIIRQSKCYGVIKLPRLKGSRPAEAVYDQLINSYATVCTFFIFIFSNLMELYL